MDVRSRRPAGGTPRLALLASIAAIALVLACGPAPGPAAPQPGSSAAPAAAPSAPAPTPSAPTADAPGALPAPVSIKVAYSELTAAQTPNWVAEEAGIYDKYGLDVDLLYI